MRRMRTRVLHVITRLDPGGSAENTLLTVAGSDAGAYESALAHGPTVGQPSPTEERARNAGVTIVEIAHLVRPVRPLKDLMALASLWRLMRRGRFHIVHTHTSKGGLLGRIAAALAGVPVVIHTPHGHVFYGYFGRVVSRVFIWLERWTAQFTDCIVALTAADRDDHLLFGVGSPADFEVIHSGVEFPRALDTEMCRRRVRRELDLEEGSLVVGTLGRLTAVKGQDDLLRAFATLLHAHQSARLLLVGEGEEEGNLRRLAADLGVAEKVEFCGWKSDVFAALSAMDLFALPSLNEGMGKALVEAMYVGLPVVATRVGGVPELVEEGVHGLLVPAGDPVRLAAALEDLASDPEKRHRFGSAGARRAASYSTAHMLQKISSMYERLMCDKAVEVIR